MEWSRIYNSVISDSACDESLYNDVRAGYQVHSVLPAATLQAAHQVQDNPEGAGVGVVDQDNILPCKTGNIDKK